jgi:hypothetical protein
MLAQPAMPPTIYQQVLGSGFSRLPEKLRELHAFHGHMTYAGRADIQRGNGLLARLCAAIAGLPPSMRDAPTSVEFIASQDGETWNRNFGGKPMCSRLTCHDGLLQEQLGPIQFHFELRAADDEIRWHVKSVKLLGLPLPARLFHGVRCRERESQGRYVFCVEATLPWIGLVIRYEGWLQPA